ncbi:MAG TPA: Ni/Fe hydrogenase subunit alpha [Gammaproteobacteria bacterium]|nr:Ni/Fe hydrogenase subunit alpha [Gammaproteobacteria bacterium]
MRKNNVTIEVPVLARVEGEGALELQITDGKISSLKLRIYEPPRLFEKFLEKRPFSDVLDFVARICGICPVAYQMSAVHAIESCFDIHPDAWVRAMRRLFYCGEWLESHSMHIHFLAIPDFFGYSSALDMAKDYPNEIKRGLQLQHMGNAIISLLGARSVHPVGACVGGFYHAPSVASCQKLLQQVAESLESARQLIHWVDSISFPDIAHEFTCVSLRHPTEYPMNEGQIISNKGMNISIEDFADYFQELQVPYSNALHCKLQDETYLVGPLARLNNNYDRLPEEVIDLLRTLNIQFPSYNMCHSILARSIEIYYCLLEAKRLLENYDYPTLSKTEVLPQAGIGFGCTEAPRGMLWHSYAFDENGIVQKARIVPPTSQNQARIEQDLQYTLENYGLEKSAAELRSFSEMLIRNYDPCISCSTHFLDLRVKRL